MTRPPYYSSGGLARGIATTSDSLIRKIRQSSGVLNRAALSQGRFEPAAPLKVRVCVFDQKSKFGRIARQLLFVEESIPVEKDHGCVSDARLKILHFNLERGVLCLKAKNLILVAGLCLLVAHGIIVLLLPVESTTIRTRIGIVRNIQRPRSALVLSEVESFHHLQNFGRI